MLADPRSEALTATRPASGWICARSRATFRLRRAVSDFDDNLRQSYRRETELLFDSLIREDRPITELLTADYTFVDERLAKAYEIPGIYGSRFQRVTLGPELDARRGLLGKGSLLATSSQPGRTSPVIRGYWVLQNLLGTPPPPPPEDVPDLPANEADAAGNTAIPTMRQQMERHRADPACSGCHMLMDPIGFALERAMRSAWRIRMVRADRRPSTRTTAPRSRPWDLGTLLAIPTNSCARPRKLLTYALGGVEYYDSRSRLIAREAAGRLAVRDLIARWSRVTRSATTCREPSRRQRAGAATAASYRLRSRSGMGSSPRKFSAHVSARRGAVALPLLESMHPGGAVARAPS